MEPLTGETAEPCSFGILIKPCRAGRHIGELSVTWLRSLVYSHQLVVLRGFDHFASSDSLTRYCATFGEIMMWPYGAVLELVEHANPDDHIFANSYVPLHWDGMYFDTVPEFQLFPCVHAVGNGRHFRVLTRRCVLQHQPSGSCGRALTGAISAQSNYTATG
ncbi:pyoverdine chromophore biosynthetic protein PvcB [Erwinia amylovora MR1]|uniref:TauD/TfdA family dioxygenase n=1 Tax=Erwinia amylovora TaxID=552 RepID=UPI0002C8B5CE|nr:TauD/TfdA family dioxygenase [Erwinia amylovora]CCP07239.1 pyoverdine chromophore biosynthetic protein PvcB [Erwinia amylovora MR1]